MGGLIWWVSYLRGRGVSKAKTLNKGKYEDASKLKIPEGWGY